MERLVGRKVSGRGGEGVVVGEAVRWRWWGIREGAGGERGRREMVDSGVAR
jgi:hypothetical protein